MRNFLHVVILPPSSKSKCKPSKKPVRSCRLLLVAGFLLGLLLVSENGGNTFLRNAGWTSTGQYGATSQKIVLFLATTLRSSYHTLLNLLIWYKQSHYNIINSFINLMRLRLHFVCRFYEMSSMSFIIPAEKFEGPAFESLPKTNFPVWAHAHFHHS
jgi:hypothetical protein